MVEAKFVLISAVWKQSDELVTKSAVVNRGINSLPGEIGNRGRERLKEVTTQSVVW
jgi:hypothetical protein